MHGVSIPKKNHMFGETRCDIVQQCWKRTFVVNVGVRDAERCRASGSECRHVHRFVVVSRWHPVREPHLEDGKMRAFNRLVEWFARS